MSNITFSPQKYSDYAKFQFWSFRYKITLNGLLSRTKHYPTISTIPFSSKQPKESKSTLGSSKNIVKLYKSGFKDSDENTLRQKLVQKSILKFLSCSPYSRRQNPIKFEQKNMQNCSQNLKERFGRIHQ